MLQPFQLSLGLTTSTLVHLVAIGIAYSRRQSALCKRLLQCLHLCKRLRFPHGNLEPLFLLF